MADKSIAARFGSGRAVTRIEDAALVTGQGRYTDDIELPGQAYLVFARSPHAHAAITRIDSARAMAMPGVVAVFTGRDLTEAGVKPMQIAPSFQRADGSPCTSPPYCALATDTVRFVGEAVAAIVADSRAHALDALDALDIDYDAKPAVVSIDAALAGGAPPVWASAPDNLAGEMRHGDAQACEAAFKRAKHVVALELINQRLAGAPMEPRVVSADFDAGDERLTMRISSQMPTAVRGVISEALGLPVTAVRVLVSDVGGGFGIKTGGYPEDIVVAWAARRLRRPVKWTSDRGEDLLASRPGRDLKTRAELALDQQGKVLALRVHSHANCGAYANTVALAIQLMIGPWVSTSIYDIQTIDVYVKAVMTHTAPTGPYRGAGRPEAIYVIERLFDRAARQIGIDPAELRRRNLIAPTAFPYTNAMKQVYDVGQFGKIFEAGLEQADWTGFDKRAAQSRARGKLRGRGLASFLEWTGGNAFEERVNVTVKPEGEIEIMSATQAMGQGIATSYAQLAVDVFDVPIEKIRIVQGDTDRANGFGSAGSRSLFTGGTAVREGATKTVETARRLAADQLEAAAGDIEYSGGSFRVAGTDLSVSLFELAAKQSERRIVVESDSKVAGPTWPNGCHVCEVEIDPQTGAVNVDAYSSVNDVGRVVNPLIVVGQIDGGAAQGIGQALCEQIVYDEQSGQMLTASFMDYAMPRVDLVNLYRTSTDQTVPSTNNPLGVKGVGELGTIGATPAVANAVVDALLRAGVPADVAFAMQMPFTSSKIWAALNQRTS